MKLTKRLEKIASYVPKGSIVADVGTDHGYIPIYLAKHKIAKKVYAMDINKGPLKKAEENIREYQVGDIITTILSNGLKSFNEQADTIIIAGMGGKLISQILEEGKDKLESVNVLILSPHLDSESVRSEVHKNNYKIINEEFIIDEGKYYPIIICEKGIEKYEKQIHYKYGKILLENKNVLLKEYLEKAKRNNSNILKGLKNQNTDNALNRIKELEEELDEINEVISCLQK
jgi:tRNA (adenine22-N1)-methyltransferase